MTRTVSHGPTAYYVSIGAAGYTKGKAVEVTVEYSPPSHDESGVNTAGANVEGDMQLDAAGLCRLAAARLKAPGKLDSP